MICRWCATCAHNTKSFKTSVPKPDAFLICTFSPTVFTMQHACCSSFSNLPRACSLKSGTSTDHGSFLLLLIPRKRSANHD